MLLLRAPPECHGRLANEDGSVESPRVQIAGSTTRPEEALEYLEKNTVDTLFLDIQMPGMTGFELLSRLHSQPMTVFTTAFDQYALDAFEVNSIDYLLKPIEAHRLDRALTKLERLFDTAERFTETERLRAIARELAQGLSPAQAFPKRIACRRARRRCGCGVDHSFLCERQADLRFHVLERLCRRQHDFGIGAEAGSGTVHPYSSRDASQRELYRRDDFLVRRRHGGTPCGMVVRLKDVKHTELQVARDRVRQLRSRLDF